MIMYADSTIQHYTDSNIYSKHTNETDLVILLFKTTRFSQVVLRGLTK